MAETMRQRLAADRSVGNAAGHQVVMTASFGVTALDLGAPNVAELVDQADQAMYTAKQAGRNRAKVFSPQRESEIRIAEEEAAS